MQVALYDGTHRFKGHVPAIIKVLVDLIYKRHLTLQLTGAVVQL